MVLRAIVKLTMVTHMINLLLLARHVITLPVIIYPLFIYNLDNRWQIMYYLNCLRISMNRMHYKFSARAGVSPNLCLWLEASKMVGEKCHWYFKSFEGKKTYELLTKMQQHIFGKKQNKSKQIFHFLKTIQHFLC